MARNIGGVSIYGRLIGFGFTKFRIRHPYKINISRKLLLHTFGVLNNSIVRI